LFVFATVSFVGFSTFHDQFSQKFNWKKKKIFSCFSLSSNFNDFIKINSSESVIKCINSLKVLSAFWIVIGHRNAQSRLLSTDDSLLGQEVLMFFKGFQRGVTVFFVCSAILVMQSLFKAFDW
jgi:hypothetical protein